MTGRTVLLGLCTATSVVCGCGNDETTAPDGAPEVTMAAPADSSFFEPGELITFRGSAYDPDGAAIDSLVWTSSRDGRLGEGSWIVRDLSLGGHTIRLRAHADDGGIGDATAFVTVREPHMPAAVSVISAFIGDQGWEAAGQIQASQKQLRSTPRSQRPSRNAPSELHLIR